MHPQAQSIGPPLAGGPSSGSPRRNVAQERLPPIIGTHPAITNIQRRLPQLARSRTPLLIVGAGGTGKTLIARHIHSLSSTISPLVIINLAVLPDRDQRLALFGGEPLEFTSTYRGALEEETTLLIKNVDRASAHIRERLSACLRAGRLKRPGSSVVRPVRCRAIFTMSQTPRRLLRLSKSDSSMRDFFRRCTTLALPPLHRRPDDLPALLGSLLLRRSLIAVAARGDLADNLHDLLALLDVVCPPGAESVLEDHERRAFARIQRAITDCREFSLRSAISALEARLAHRALVSSKDCRQSVARRLGMSSRTLERMSHASP